jgi:hypothetical protein
MALMAGLLHAKGGRDVPGKLVEVIGDLDSITPDASNPGKRARPSSRSHGR